MQPAHRVEPLQRRLGADHLRSRLLHRPLAERLALPPHEPAQLVEARLADRRILPGQHPQDRTIEETGEAPQARVAR